MLEELAIGSALPIQSAPIPAEAPTVPTTPSVSDATAASGHLALSLELNAEIGIVVIQFRDQSGKVELSIPSQQQLDAYAADPASIPRNDSSTTV